MVSAISSPLSLNLILTDALNFCNKKKKN
jgi:hypothetical protein